MQLHTWELFLSDWNPHHPAKQRDKQNGPILTEFKGINNVVSSEAEYETTGVLSNLKRSVEIRPSLIDLVHP